MEYDVNGTIWYGSKDPSDSDYCGKGCYWRVDGDTLIIGGSGKVEWSRRYEDIYVDEDDEDEEDDGNEYHIKQFYSEYLDEYYFVTVPYDGKYRRLVIEEGITSIDDLAFENEHMESVKLPDSIYEIGLRTFDGCSSLKSITASVNVINSGWAGRPLLSHITDVVMTGKARSIRRNAFSDYSSLENITFPMGVEEICDGAFWNCKSLKRVVIPRSVEIIGNDAFCGCESLKEVVFLGGVKRIENLAFSGCKSLKTVTLKEGATWIGDLAFSGCDSLERIVIPESVEHIGRGLVTQDSLKEIVFGGSRLRFMSILKASGNNYPLESMRRKGLKITFRKRLF
ncbi:MAG: leucine-rich repeat domain-containing protein [Oscillospiraceae bacterium]|nr:leucine-rich repeat domain-containing protein [Oscillospiraceae bacterium]